MSLSALLLLTGFLLSMAVALTALILAARNASEGYEDNAGFHGGRSRSSRVRTSQLVKPILEERLKIMLMPDVPISCLILAPGTGPKPPQMDMHPMEVGPTAPTTPLLPVNLSVSGLSLQLNPVDAPTPKRKRKVARKDDPTDGNQLGFPGFAA